MNASVFYRNLSVTLRVLETLHALPKRGTSSIPRGILLLYFFKGNASLAKPMDCCRFEILGAAPAAGGQTSEKNGGLNS